MIYKRDKLALLFLSLIKVGVVFVQVLAMLCRECASLEKPRERNITQIPLTLFNFHKTNQSFSQRNSKHFYQLAYLMNK